MRVIFRTDASTHIGAGHVMRCLTLADTLRDRGAWCGFVCREHPGHLLDLIRARGHEALALPQAAESSVTLRQGGRHSCAEWLGVDWIIDAQQTMAVMQEARPVDWLVVDHYALDERWESLLRPYSNNLLVIDDLADRPHQCDLLLDQNLNRRSADYDHLCSQAAGRLIGTRYALLRPDFAELRDYSFARRNSAQLKHLLISMGGVDKDNATGALLNAFISFDLPPGLRTTVVMGPHAPWLTEVRDQAAQMRSVDVLVNAQNMAKIIAESDLAIGAAGTSAWERCCLGLPTLALVLAENQRGGAAALNAIGAISLLELGPNLPHDLSLKMRELQDTKCLRKMQEACRLVCDGLGVERVVEAMHCAD